MSVDLLPHFFFKLPDGGQLRYAQFAPATAARGTVLILPGRREFIEKKYAELGPRLLALGLRVVIVEPRGHGLSTRFLKDDMRQRDHIDSFTTHLADLRAFFDAIVRPGMAGPLIVHGHSLGGHLVLRWLAEDRPPVAGAFVTAPMLALSGMPTQLAAYGISWTSVRLFSHETNYAVTQHDYGAEDLIFAQNPLTQDETRFRIIEDYFTAHPELTVGGVTWGWMLAALQSMNVSHSRAYLNRINVPVLALVGEHDPVTPYSDIAPLLNHIPSVRTHIISGARHDLLNEGDAALTEAWALIEAFIKDVALVKNVTTLDGMVVKTAAE